MSITIYSKNNCMKCKQTKRFFEQAKVPFTEINIENEAENPKSMQEYIDWIKNDLELSVMPIVVTDTDTWGDFQLDKIRKTIAAYNNQ